MTLQRCCPFDINNFAGYAKITSTWLMQYMNTDSRLVETEVDAATNSLTIKSMFYEGYDIKISLDDSDPLAPRVIVPEEQVLGSTGEAFGTIYGNGKLIPAVVNNTVASFSGNTDADGISVCPFDLKNSNHF